MRDEFIHIIKDNKWLIQPEGKIIKERIKNIPKIYKKSAIKTINDWDNEEVTTEQKNGEIKKHLDISNKIEGNKFTKEQNKEFESIIKCNAYNNKSLQN